MCKDHIAVCIYHREGCLWTKLCEYDTDSPDGPSYRVQKCRAAKRRNSVCDQDQRGVYVALFEACPDCRRRTEERERGKKEAKRELWRRCKGWVAKYLGD